MGGSLTGVADKPNVRRVSNKLVAGLCVTMNLQPRTFNPRRPQSDDRWPMTRGRLLLVAVLLEDDIDVARRNC